MTSKTAGEIRLSVERYIALFTEIEQGMKNEQAPEVAQLSELNNMWDSFNHRQKADFLEWFQTNYQQTIKATSTEAATLNTTTT